MRLTTVFALLILLSSCSRHDEEQISSQYTGEWELVLMYGWTPDNVSTGDEMEWQETYSINPDGTFSKIRVRDGITKQVTGTYKIYDETPETKDHPNLDAIIIMNHESADIIATCESSLDEHLYFSKDNRMISLQNQCDGVGLEYEK